MKSFPVFDYLVYEGWESVKTILKRPRNAFLIIFCFSLTLRIIWINPGFFHHDSILYLESVKKSVEQATLIPHLEGRYFYVLTGVPVFLLTKWLSLPEDLTFNITTAILGSLATCALYLLARLMFRSNFVSIASAVFLSVIPPFFSITTHTKEHGLSVLLIIFSLYFVLKGNLESKKRTFFISGIFFVLAISVRIPNLLFALPLALFYFDPRLENGRPKAKKHSFYEHLYFAAPVVFGLALIYHKQAENIRHKAIADAFRGFFTPIISIAIKDISTSIQSVGCILLVVGLVYGLIKYFYKTVYLLSWVLPFFFFYGNTRTYSLRFLTPCFPPLVILISLGNLAVYRINKITGFIVFLFLVISMFFTIYPIISFRSNYSGEKEYALWLKQQTEENATIIVTDDSPFIQYYAKRKVLLHPINDSKKTRKWINNIRGMLYRWEPVYIMESGFSYDPDRIVRTAIFNNFNINLIGKHLTEDYHHNSIKSGKYYQRLFQLENK